MIRVLIADDHALMREGLRHILEKATGFHVVGEAADGSAALHLGRTTPAQVMLVDLSMPGRNGLEVVRQLKKENVPVRTIVLTMHGEHQYAERAFKCGARGYLTKESAMTDLVTAITKVASGGVYLSPAMAERVAGNLDRDAEALPHEQLSDREFDVFRRLVNGETVSEIANGLCINSKTVSTYKMRIHQKMQMSNDVALIRYALKNGLCSDPGEDA
ncbi:response regulator [Cupriavidus sp. IDO]|uniref:response regulator n=1 Tax=Cupriavidus sp. IDO TaxID=1539142 RepID=UPI00057901BB|nr:response regulator transcription factor [Cupriavidus sp. IDO]KWR91573.1 LuxR family transcriptional regulator [Cupriavidus sp. IDO]